MTRWPPYVEWDLATSNLLPDDWDAQIQRVIASDGARTILTGDSDLSHEKVRSYQLPVIVVAGDACAKKLPWLRKLYDGELREFASKALGTQLYVAVDLRSSININCLRGEGARYESHRDSNPVTGVLFASDATAETGGELVFTKEGEPDAVVWPRKGLFIAFDAREIPHHVAALKADIDRVSLPMNYYDDPVMQHRPPGLDDYLYESRVK